jgi:hypothetical protein
MPSEDDLLRAESAARRGWQDGLAAALVRQQLNYRRPVPICTHDWRQATENRLLCLRCGRMMAMPKDEQ